MRVVDLRQKEVINICTCKTLGCPIDVEFNPKNGTSYRTRSSGSCEILRLFLPRRGFCDPMGPHLPDRQRYHSCRNSGKREKAALINGYENRIPIPAESSSILHP